MLNSYLPEDLLVLVLVKLPLEVLGRFQSVSKSWNDLISSQEFKKLRLNQSHIDGKRNILVWKDHHDRRANRLIQQLHAVEFSTTDENVELGSEIRRLYHPFESLEYSRFKPEIVGCCNGLLCLILWRQPEYDLNRSPYYLNYENNICLCNPLTKSSWDLPKRLVVLNDGKKKPIRCYGFGYDDVHDDYKVIIASHPHYYENGLEFEFYSLRSNSWSMAGSYPEFYYDIIDEDGALVNCALHWILGINHPDFDDDGRKYSLVAFDLRTDKLKILPIPKSLEKIDCLEWSVLNGCLVLSTGFYYHSLDPHRDPRDDEPYSFDLWIMKDYGLKDSWMRITIHDSPEYDLYGISPVAILEYNNNHKRKLIFYNDFKGNFLSYDLISHQVVVEFLFPASGDFPYADLQFVGSLVQPHPPSFGDKKSKEEKKQQLTI